MALKMGSPAPPGASAEALHSSISRVRTLLAAAACAALLAAASLSRHQATPAILEARDDDGDVDESSYAVGSPAPSFSLALTDGTPFEYPSAARDGSPLVVVALDGADRRRELISSAGVASCRNI